MLKTFSFLHSSLKKRTKFKLNFFVLRKSRISFFSEEWTEWNFIRVIQNLRVTDPYFIFFPSVIWNAKPTYTFTNLRWKNNSQILKKFEFFFLSMELNILLTERIEFLLNLEDKNKLKVWRNWWNWIGRKKNGGLLFADFYSYFL